LYITLDILGTADFNAGMCSPPVTPWKYSLVLLVQVSQKNQLTTAPSMLPSSTPALKIRPSKRSHTNHGVRAHCESKTGSTVDQQAVP
jgi:hypothetical protein